MIRLMQAEKWLADYHWRQRQLQEINPGGLIWRASQQPKTRKVKTTPHKKKHTPPSEGPLAAGIIQKPREKPKPKVDEKTGRRPISFG